MLRFHDNDSFFDFYFLWPFFISRYFKIIISVLLVWWTKQDFFHDTSLKELTTNTTNID